MIINVLLADDHRLVREGLCALLERQADITVIGEASDGQEAIRLARELKPDVVVMDIAMPALNGIDATRQITTELPGVSVVVLSMHGHKQIVMELLNVGAKGYLLKDCANESLAQAVRAVHSNLLFFSPEIANTVLDEHHSTRGRKNAGNISQLSNNELRILKLIAEGTKTAALAEELGVSKRTVLNYRRQVMEKLKLESVAALTKFAVQTGLVNVGGSTS